MNNDVVIVCISDLWDSDPHPLGWVYGEDPEHGTACMLQASASSCEQQRKANAHMREMVRRQADSHRIGFIAIEEGQDPLIQLRVFFENRRSLV